MIGTPRLSPELRTGRRALDGMADVALLDDWVWSDSDQRWMLHIRLSVDIPAGAPVPSVSDWWVLAESTYPLGALKVYPAKTGSIESTFPHQSYNGSGQAEQPWRSGGLCLDTTVRALGRHGHDPEPRTAADRLWWHVARAQQWLWSAAHDQLAVPGDPFELPDFSASQRGDIVVSSEGAQSSTFWSTCSETAGWVDLVLLKPGVYVATCFRSASGRKIFDPPWGHVIATRATETTRAAWLRLPSVPIVPPWQAPTTWGELRQAARSQHVLLDKLLWPVLKRLRDGHAHLALIGFSMPAAVGAPPSQVHWQALQLPVLTHQPPPRRGQQRSVTRDGYRPNELGYSARDRETVLSDRAALSWLRSQNWHAEQIATRGVLPPTLTEQRTLVLGGGAVGSVLAELLVRAGVSTVTIMDDDMVMVGNLVRHTLGLSDVHRAKASALADRLNNVSPHAKVVGLDQRFPPTDDETFLRVQQHDLIIDCTGRDEVLAHLEQFPWNEPKRFVSISLGVQAQRLFCFTAEGERFPRAAFWELIQPWLQQERAETPPESFPREGVGCWHPVFPARVDDVWLLASIAIKHLDAFAAHPCQRPRLTVVEQQYVDGVLSGTQTSVSEAADG